MRDQIRDMVAAIQPMDRREAQDRQECLDWIASGAELCRLAKPATPPQHLVAYFPVIDGDHILLVDHINAGLWLPTGGHIEPGEHPAETVRRECQEELGIGADFIQEDPLFLTIETTVGRTGGHSDVTLWFPLRGNRQHALNYDASEFLDVTWVPTEALPETRTDPNLARFLAKLGART